MSKEQSLMRRFSSGISESIGVREDENTQPTYSTGASTSPRRNFKVDRSIGEIEANEVFPDPKQPRKNFDETSLQRLGEDIRDRTQLQPIGVRWDEENGRWLIVYGERRWRAITKVGLPTIKCRFFMSDVDETELRSIQLVENLQRENLKPIEEAQGYQDLMTLNKWNGKEVAEYLHVSATKVSRGLKLLALPDEVRAKVDDGTIAPSTAYQVAKEKNSNKRAKLVKKVLAGELDEQSARAETTKTKASAKTARRSTNETFLVANGIRVVVSGRRFVGDSGVLDSLLEAVEKQRAKVSGEQQSRAA